MVCSSIARAERPNIHYKLCADGAERSLQRQQKRLHSDEKRVNYPAIKHKEMVSSVVYRNRLMVPAGVWLYVCVWEGCAVIYYHCRAQQQVSCQCFDQVARDKKGIPLQNRRGFKPRACVCVCVCVCMQICLIQLSPQGHVESSCSFAAFSDNCTAVLCIRRERHAAAISSKCVNRMLLSHCASQKIDNERLAH